jgi:hypothetical protein
VRRRLEDEGFATRFDALDQEMESTQTEQSLSDKEA